MTYRHQVLYLGRTPPPPYAAIHTCWRVHSSSSSNSACMQQYKIPTYCTYANANQSSIHICSSTRSSSIACVHATISHKQSLETDFIFSQPHTLPRYHNYITFYYTRTSPPSVHIQSNHSPSTHTHTHPSSQWCVFASPQEWISSMKRSAILPTRPSCLLVFNNSLSGSLPSAKDSSNLATTSFGRCHGVRERN